METDKTARAPLLQLVSLESLQRLGASDFQTDSPAGFACPAAVFFQFVLNCAGANVEATAYQQQCKNNRVASHIC